MRYTSVGRPERHRHDLVAVALLVLAAWLLTSLDSPTRIALTRGVRATVLAPFLAAHRALAARSELTRRVEALEAQRDRLAREVVRAADLEAENAGLRRLLELPERRPGIFRPAEVVAGGAVDGESHAFLARTRRAVEIRAPAGVVTANGLLGVIRSGGRRSAFGEFWTHPDFRVAVRVSEGVATGIVRPVRTETGETLMLLEGVPFQARVEPGVWLVTAGVGGVYPPGIRVGRVLTVAESKSGWSRSYLVQPAVRPAATRSALVWLRPSGESRDTEAGAVGEPGAGRVDAGGEETGPRRSPAPPDEEP